VAGRRDKEKRRTWSCFLRPQTGMVMLNDLLSRGELF
jgi:hypothetical protein